jgi:hypothetical protein
MDVRHRSPRNRISPSPNLLSSNHMQRMRTQWLAQFFDPFKPARPRRPRRQRRGPGPEFHWLVELPIGGGHSTFARTKSEARARIKAKLGLKRLPIGSKVTRLPGSRHVAA